jgi:4-amino-4-deoxy-L-arabinose transferase-like glycosyltransferase
MAVNAGADQPQQGRSGILADRRSLLFLLVTAVSLWIGCFYGLNAAGLFDLDEGLYASVARQMAETGDWLVPRIGSVVFFDKPPLTYWLQAFSVRFLGATPAAVRLPSAIAAALTALALCWWARRRGIERAGWLAAIIYPLCPLTVGLARQATMDSLLALWFTVTVIGWIEGCQGDRRWYLLMATGAALATMTKGLIGLVLPGAAFLLWLLIRRDFGEFRRVPWIPAWILYLALVLPWHLAVWHVSGNLFLQEYIVHHHIMRFLGKEFGHNAPFWAYLPVLLIGLFPWFVIGVWAGWQSLRASRSRPPAAEPDRSLAMWALWAVVIIVFFSLGKSKLPGYIQPATPALALLAAVRLDRAWSARRGLTRGEGIVIGATGLLLGVLLLTAGGLGWWWRSQPVPTIGSRVVPAGTSVPIMLLAPTTLAIGGLFLAGCLGFLLTWSSIPRLTGVMVGVNLALVVLLARFGLPTWNAYDIRPLHHLALQALPGLHRGEPLVVYSFRHRRPSLRYVLGPTQRLYETGIPAVLQQVARNAPSGAILVNQGTPLPPLAAALRQQSAEGRWILWRWERGAKAETK